MILVFLGTNQWNDYKRIISTKVSKFVHNKYCFMLNSYLLQIPQINFSIQWHAKPNKIHWTFFDWILFVIFKIVSCYFYYLFSYFSRCQVRGCQATIFVITTNIIAELKLIATTINIPLTCCFGIFLVLIKVDQPLIPRETYIWIYEWVRRITFHSYALRGANDKNRKRGWSTSRDISPMFYQWDFVGFWNRIFNGKLMTFMYRWK